MPTDHCPVCDRPLSEHPDGLACCPLCGTPTRAVENDGGMAVCRDCGASGWAEDWNRRAPHAETLALRETVAWQNRRLDLLQQVQSRMRDPERTLVCDILANGALLPDPHGTRHGIE